MFTSAPPPQIRKVNNAWQRGEALGVSRASGRASGDAGVCCSRHVAPISVSRRSWSFSPINSVVPRSRSPLPRTVRDAERRAGEPGVALLAGVRGENSPHYTKRPSERKNAKTILAPVYTFVTANSHDIESIA